MIYIALSDVFLFGQSSEAYSDWKDLDSRLFLSLSTGAPLCLASLPLSERLHWRLMVIIAETRPMKRN
jgi:hypothetical protein